MTPLIDANDLLRLREALDDYEGAKLGRLNLTSDALRAAASRVGYDWRKDGPVAKWSADRVGKR